MLRSLERWLRRGRVLWASLGVRLFLWLFALVIAAFATYAFLNVRATSAQWQAEVHIGALRFSELIAQSTHYAMLLNRKQDVHHIIGTVARAPGVVGVRIYDKEGRIIYSAEDGEIGRRVDLEAQACIVCHQGPKPLEWVPTGNRMRVYRGADGSRILGLIRPIENEQACSTAACHAHPPEKTILGVLDVQMSMQEADARLAGATRLSTGAAVAMALVVGVFSALFIDRGVRRPVRRLIDAVGRVGRGDFATRLALDDSRSEIGALAAAFNGMADELERAEAENRRWSGELERKVLEKTEELSRTQRQVLHMEKMASLGKLAATVAHELNNPLAGILNYAKLVSRSLESGSDDPGERRELMRFLEVIQNESRRCGDVVRNLLLFARRSGAEMALVEVNPIIDRALMLVRHQLEMAEIRLETRYLAGDDRVVCDANQVQQALVALLVNAIEAMGGGGTLRVTVEAAREDGQPAVAVSVEDSGCGMPPEVRAHIFEPFFTTKTDGGGGSGLGLAVVYGIVQRHGGRIEVQSEEGRGSTFRLILTRRPQPRSGDAARRPEPEPARRSVPE